MTVPRIRLAFPHPDFVMVGMPAPNGPGVWLLASKKLGSGLMRGGTIGRGPDGTMTGQQVRLMVQLADFVVVEAEDYPAAFRALFEQWSPEPDARPEIEAGPAAIAPYRPQTGPGR
jgi:hypothetical protein